MSQEGGRPVRAYRPSQYGLFEEPCEEAELIRLANIEEYAKRASAGLPIFEETPEPGASLISGKRNH
jgi:hypothetical protein